MMDNDVERTALFKSGEQWRIGDNMFFTIAVPLLLWKRLPLEVIVCLVIILSLLIMIVRLEKIV